MVVSACTPRTHEPLFQDTLREAGLNRALFEMANIRDQCSWVHMHEKEAATEKSKDLVRMAVAKARLLTPLPEQELPVTPSALVIGGGLAGMTAALTIGRTGIRVHPGGEGEDTGRPGPAPHPGPARQRSAPSLGEAGRQGEASTTRSPCSPRPELASHLRLCGQLHLHRCRARRQAAK